MTNEEKIRKMSREELAEFILGKRYPYCSGAHNCTKNYDCHGCAFDWPGEDVEEVEEAAEE